MTQAANLAALGTNAGTTGILPIAGGGTAGTGGAIGFKNRIINGAMVIDQRNAGASVTPTDQTYSLDRWKCRLSQASKYTVQQNAGSVTPPAGFRNYLGVTSTAATSVGTNDYFAVQQIIEGFNVADLNYGTANAQTTTLSFWVRSSLTGTFGGALQNSAENRNYGFTYSISSANTWEQKSITIAGDTSGTWLTTNGIGLYVNFNLGTGSTYGSASNGSWASGGTQFTPSGTVSVVGTNGATFYITGVQLEVGTAATNFDVRSYGTELMLCQRYFEICCVRGTGGSYILGGYASGSNFSLRDSLQFSVTKRATPTMTVVGTWSANGTGQPFIAGQGITGFRTEATSTTSGNCYVYPDSDDDYITASSEL